MSLGSQSQIPRMERFRKFFYWAGSTLLLLLVVSVFLPSEVQVQRAINIDAHQATIFALANDFHQVAKWAPWTARDPNARIEFGGPDRGVGAVIRWEGSILGRGSETIVESVRFERIVKQLSGDGRGAATSTLVLGAENDSTTVTWSHATDFGMNLPGRYFGLMLESTVGDDLVARLESLKTMAESLPRADFSDIDIEHIVVEASQIAYLTATSLPEPASIAEATGNAYFEVLGFIDDQGLKEAGAPIIISRGFSGSNIRFDAGIPVRGVTEQTARSGGGVQLGSTFAGPVIRVRHVGSYADLKLTHDKIAAYLAALGIERNGDAWESYVSDPTRTAEADLVTYVYYPVR